MKFWYGNGMLKRTEERKKGRKNCVECSENGGKFCDSQKRREKKRKKEKRRKQKRSEKEQEYYASRRFGAVRHDFFRYKKFGNVRVWL